MHFALDSQSIRTMLGFFLMVKGFLKLKLHQTCRWKQGMKLMWLSSKQEEHFNEQNIK